VDPRDGIVDRAFHGELGLGRRNVQGVRAQDLRRQGEKLRLPPEAGARHAGDPCHRRCRVLHPLPRPAVPTAVGAGHRDPRAGARRALAVAPYHQALLAVVAPSTSFHGEPGRGRRVLGKESGFSMVGVRRVDLGRGESG
jgi:hypothetical protein